MAIDITPTSPVTNGFRLGIDPSLCATELRQLADRIEKRELLVKSITHLVNVGDEEFVMNTIGLVIHEKVEG